jgi:hypothetical protein
MAVRTGIGSTGGGGGFFVRPSNLASTISAFSFWNFGVPGVTPLASTSASVISARRDVLLQVVPDSVLDQPHGNDKQEEDLVGRRFGDHAEDLGWLLQPRRFQRAFQLPGPPGQLLPGVHVGLAHFGLLDQRQLVFGAEMLGQDIQEWPPTRVAGFRGKQAPGFFQLHQIGQIQFGAVSAGEISANKPS